MHKLILLFVGLTFDRKVEEELSKELNLQIKGAEKPSVWGLIGIRFLLLPYTIGKVSALPHLYNEMQSRHFFTGYFNYRSCDLGTVRMCDQSVYSFYCGMVVGSGGTTSNELHTLGKMLLT